MRTSIRIILGVFIAFMLLGCDPNREIGKFFSSLGLNRLAIARDDIQPASLVIVKGNRAVYESSIYDWVNGETGPIATLGANRAQEYNAVIASYSGDRKLDASVAVTLLKTVLPVDIGESLGLKNSVTIDVSRAKSVRVSPAAIQKYIQTDSGIRTHLAEILSRGQKAYIVYEVYTSPQLTIKSDSGTDVSSTIDISKTEHIGKGNIKFAITRTAKEALQITGDHPYAFAIRAALVVPSKVEQGQYALDVTDYPAPPDVKAAGEESYKYTAALAAKPGVDQAKAFEVPVKISRE